MTNKEKIIYLAGIIDGEGWISIRRGRRMKETHARSYMPTVGVANTNKILIDWLTDNFGGSVVERKPAEKQYGRRLRYEWILNSTQTKKFLPSIISSLLLKKKQAQVAIDIGKLNSVNYRRRGVPKEIQLAREKLYLELRGLNDTLHKIVSRFD